MNTDARDAEFTLSVGTVGVAIAGVLSAGRSARGS
jgi:hypothetical protein